MSPELEHLVKLQQLDSEVGARRNVIGELPQVLQALDARLTARQTAVDDAKARLAENQNQRRTLEKELSVVQGRLTKFKEQLMEVKTNKEYTAMQHEIQMAQDGVRVFEDQMLELMVLADDINNSIKAADKALTDERTKVTAERSQLEGNAKKLTGEIESLERARDEQRKLLSGDAAKLFDHVSRARKGAMAEARDGHCTACHVRLRPQMYNEVRRGDRLIQCESCTRILYILPPKPAAPPNLTEPAAGSAQA
jgi:predicted  nucleic acid-binding Zn-ribbon protein